jgi:hypothetical protein
LLDCDVEEPNAHLFIHGKLRLGEAMSPPCLGRIPLDKDPAIEIKIYITPLK